MERGANWNESLWGAGHAGLKHLSVQQPQAIAKSCHDLFKKDDVLILKVFFFLWTSSAASRWGQLHVATRQCVKRYSSCKRWRSRGEFESEVEAEPCFFLRLRETSKLLFDAFSLNVNVDAQTFSGQVLLREESCSFGSKCISRVGILHSYIHEDGGGGVDQRSNRRMMGRLQPRKKRILLYSQHGNRP